VAVAKESAVYLKRILFSVLDFASASGLEPSEMEGILAAWMKSAKSKRGKLGVTERSTLGADVDQIYGLVLHRWHRESALLDQDAKPRGLRLFGKHPSVEGLIRAESGDGLARAIAQSLLDVGLVEKRRGGLYYPTSRVATIRRMHPMVIEHVSKSLSRFLGTVQQNTSGQKDEFVLIERYAQIPDLPKEEIRNFRKFSQAHGAAFLAGVDDWMEPRRKKRKSLTKNSGCAAGIHVFAYVHEPEKPVPTTLRAKRA